KCSLGGADGPLITAFCYLSKTSWRASINDCFILRNSPAWTVAREHGGVFSFCVDANGDEAALTERRAMRVRERAVPARVWHGLGDELRQSVTKPIGIVKVDGVPSLIEDGKMLAVKGHAALGCCCSARRCRWSAGSWPWFGCGRCSRPQDRARIHGGRGSRNIPSPGRSAHAARE